MTIDVARLIGCPFVLVLFAAALGCTSMHEHALHRQEKQMKTEVMIDRLPFSDQEAIIDSIVESGDLSRLQRIANSDTRISYYAVKRFVKAAPAEQAIRYVQALPKGSRKWNCAITTFRSKEKKEVLPYLVQLAQSEDAVCRYYAYQICRVNTWPELADFATKDLEADFEVGLSSDPTDRKLNLGQMAREYLDALELNR